tara:strand:+ start:916 stop:1521 length:606 start_codon:yes stop_codon:yes gene_type:complete
VEKDMKKRITTNRAKRQGKDVLGRVENESDTISAAVWGQLAPLDKIAREKVEKWGDRLPSLVSPETAGKFEAAYDALGNAVKDNDVMRTHKLAGQLMKGWKVLEDEAMSNGHEPLHGDAYCVEMEEGDIVCFALNEVRKIREQNPTWVVYSFEDAARVLREDFSSRFLDNAFNSFPNAKVTEVIRNGEPVNWALGGDEIPW